MLRPPNLFLDVGCSNMSFTPFLVSQLVIYFSYVAMSLEDTLFIYLFIYLFYLFIYLFYLFIYFYFLFIYCYVCFYYYCKFVLDCLCLFSLIWAIFV